MGASSWHYTTAYSDDPNAALQQLRTDVFNSGRYGDPFANVSIWTQLKNMPIAVKLIVIVAKGFYAMSSLASWIARGCRRPRSIEEAITLAAESGTHSILDIERCSQTPDFGVAWQLQPAIRKRLYGTEHPTTADLDRVGWQAAAENLDRWQAVYFPVYDDGNPVSLVFVGCSGD
ncbi:hypothetical protein [Roseiconus lacunae]|uniref:Uncharacterized protein n=1 Tax=Roseiconus lacunae TaxID=2605694 RepID=A0ABT7PSR7_9BACT|nr:hypothetical protein [Roseiconus lacunae]MDM4019543.1 hypothetical protein [Roseiconus lacunae]